MKKIFFTFILLFVFIVPFSVGAYEVQNKDLIFVDKDEVVEGNLYAFGSSAIINGRVNGDVICFAGESLKIDGTVTGDVIAGASIITINGEVHGSVRVAGEIVNIDGDVLHGVQVAAVSVNFGESSNVGADVLLGASSANIEGNVVGTLHGYLDKVNVFGSIGGDVKLRMSPKQSVSGDFKPLTIKDSANVGGNIYYVSGIKGDISENAVIGGEIGHTFSRDYIKRTQNTIFNFGNIVSLFSWMVIGLIMINLGKKHIKDLLRNKDIPSWKLLGVGALVMFVTPIICFLVMFTIIGIPAALIAFVLWIIFMYLAKVLSGIMIGKRFIEKFAPSKKASLMWTMVWGILVLWILCSLPVIGWIFCLLATWYAVGTVWYYCRHLNI